METGENIQALRKIMDFTRMSSIILLLLHFYAVCYPTLREKHLTISLLDNLVFNLSKNLSFLQGINRPKSAALVLLAISVIGIKGKKDEKITVWPVISFLVIGLLLYFFSSLVLTLQIEALSQTYLYIGITTTGYLTILTGAARTSRLLWLRLQGDIFNELNESFPQEERLLTNEYSVNLPAEYGLRGKIRKSWINIINPFRATLVLGTPGSGKSYFVIRHVITQHIQKGFAFFIYDFKFPDLSRIAYNNLSKYIRSYPIAPRLYLINFDDLSRTHRCNAIPPETMFDITDAIESSRTIMLALNREWIKKSGDFFVESPINFTTAIFWYLKKYQKGKYCTLPHAIELAQINYEKLFPTLSLEPEIEVLINPFISAFMNGAKEQLEGQIASAKICLARLASPSLYYVLSGNDFTLDLNNPENPKLVCCGNNPAKQQIYGAVLSLYIERMLKLVNKKDQWKSSLVFDEFPTIYVNNIDNLIATARGNKVATTLGIQDFSQLRRDYGKEQADVIMNTSGNIISGQVIGDTARQLSERIGKIMQERESVSINSNDTSISRSHQLDAAIPASRIANLSSGEFVGAVADDPDQKIKRKVFHSAIQNDHEAIRMEEVGYRELPVIRKVDAATVMENYQRIKKDIAGLVDSEMVRIRTNPELAHLIEKKPKPKRSGISL
jgi:hypothetical protein